MTAPKDPAHDDAVLVWNGAVETSEPPLDDEDGEPDAEGDDSAAS